MICYCFMCQFQYSLSPINFVFLYFYMSAMTVLLLALLVCVRSFTESWFLLCLSLWFSIIRNLLNKNVALVPDRVHVPFLCFLGDFPSLWFLNFLNNDLYYEQMDRAVMASSVFSKMYPQLLEHTVPQQNLYYVFKRFFKMDFVVCWWQCYGALIIDILVYSTCLLECQFHAARLEKSFRSECLWGK